jgi:thiosulfate dehydrogenase (quinone) large subunit
MEDDSNRARRVTVQNPKSNTTVSLAANFKQSTYLGYLALVRILVGVLFLLVAWPKISGGRFLGGGALSQQLLNGIQKDPLAWHRAFISESVVPHAHLFSYLSAFGEISIGISLVVGCLVRISSLFGAFYNFNILFSVAYAAGGGTVNYNRVLILLHLIFVSSSAGRALGIDGLLKRRFPQSWLF